MIETLGNWLGIVAAAAFGATLLQLLSPDIKSGLGKYVKFVAAAAVLLTVITPLFKILSGLEDNLGKTGIIYQDDNINITENNMASRWVLSETLTSLENGIIRLVEEKFSISVSVDFETDITSSGIEINTVKITPPTGTVYAKSIEIKELLESYFGIEVSIENAAG